MGWPLAAALQPAAVTDHSIAVALIAALGAVLVALIGIVASRSARTSEARPTPDPKLAERVAVVDARGRDDRRTLAELDRHVDGIGDLVDKLRWEMDDVQAWREQHERGHGR